jgi:lysophospholipase L1-like esterase
MLLGALFFANVALGQSLSVVRKPDSNFWVQVVAPMSDPHTLQVSENLHLWVDGQNDVPEQYSFELDSGAATARFYRVIPTPPDAPPIRIMLLGDSMVADCCGWGPGMNGYFKANALVLNYAQPWTSTKVFLQSAEYDKMLLVQPNYVLMEYAYSDGGPDPDRYTSPQEFADNLRQIGHIIQGFNGVPVFLTLHADRQWDENGNLIPSDHSYNAITKQVAAELKAPLIDWYKITFDEFTKLGKDGCAFMIYDPGNLADGLHSSPAGAVYLSQLLSRYLPDELGPYMTGILDPPPKP